MRGSACPSLAREGGRVRAFGHGRLPVAPARGELEATPAPRARERDPGTLAHADAAISRSELIVTRQLLTLDAMARCGQDPGRARALLAAMEHNLAALYAWRERLVGKR